MTECNQETFAFTSHFSRRVEAGFTAGQVSTDGGALLLREVEGKINLLGRLAGCFSDGRSQLLVKHQLPEMLAQRIYGLALGYVKSAVAGLNGDDAGWAGPQDNYDIGADYSRSDYDDRQRLAISAVYPLPIGRGKAVLGNAPRAVDEAIGGWVISLNSSFQGGLPFTIAAGDPSNANNSYSRRANINPTPASFHKSNAQWFSSDNTTGSTNATFTQPLDGYFGTSPRNAVSAPGEINADLSLSKSFAITEKAGFELKFDAFNAFNHWNPGYPNSDINGALPGYIAPNDSANSARELQISGRFTF